MEILSVIWDWLAPRPSRLHVVNFGGLVNNFSAFSGQITDTAHIVFDIIQARHSLARQRLWRHARGRSVCHPGSIARCCGAVDDHTSRSLTTESSSTVVENEQEVICSLLVYFIKHVCPLHDPSDTLPSWFDSCESVVGLIRIWLWSENIEWRHSPSTHPEGVQSF